MRHDVYIYKGITLKSSFSVSLLLMSTTSGFSIYFQSVVEGQKSRGVEGPRAQRSEHRAEKQLFVALLANFMNS